jgi:CO/xanthine dehydrogenase Mo-binding subunit
MAVASAIGTNMPRRDAPEKLTGRARYTADLRLPGLAHCRLALSTAASARIVSIDTSVAKTMPGVLGVFVAGDLDLKGKEGGSRRLNFLAQDRVVFTGQPVAAVVAETEAQAEDAAAAIAVVYEDLPAVSDPLQGMSADAPTVRDLPAAGAEEAALHAAVVGGLEEEKEELPANVSNSIHFKRGDLAAGFAEADAVVEATYTVPVVHQGYLETQTCLVAPNSVTGGVTVYTSTQASFYTRDEVAAALDIPANLVRCEAMTIGGGFGAKYVLIDPFVAALAVRLNRPVLLAYTRTEDFLAANPSPLTIWEVKLGGKKDGTLTALQARVIFDTGAYSGSALSIGCLLLGGYYRIPNFDIRGYEVMTHKAGVGAYRAPGAPQASFAFESALDDLVEQLGLDPLDVRLQNAIVEGDLWPDGNPWPVVGLRETLQALKDHPLWQSRGTLGPYEGIGVGAGGWPGGRGPAAAACRMDPGGTLTISVGAVDLTGQTTTFAMIAAEAFGIEADKVKVVIGDTESAPHSPGSGGSQITYTVGKAVLQAAQDARQQAIAIAAQQLEASIEDLEIGDGEIRVKGAPGRSVPLAEIAQLSTSKYEPIWGHGASAQKIIAPGFAAHLARVRVDPDTGEVTLLDYVAAQDVGKALNPAAVTGQILGGAVQGIGWALSEQMLHDDQAQLLTASFMDYAMPKAPALPDIDVVLVEVPAPDGPFGARIVGEPPIIPPLAAIGNAVKAATGRRITTTPFTAERVRAALGT